MAAPRRTSQQVTLLMLVLASITVLTLDYHGEANHAITHVRDGVGEVISPFQRGIAAILHPVGQAVAGALHYGSLQEENRRLSDELATNERQLAESRYASTAAATTLSLAHLPFVENIPTVDAEVISDATSNFSDTIEIGKGTSSGVGPGMPVVADRGLVGTVVSASPNTATVQLISAAGSKISVGSLAGGNFEADGSGAGRSLSLVNFGGPVNLAAKELIYTSGLALGTYPAGIPIAVVASVHETTGGVTQQIAATPLVNANTLQYVAVLQWLAPA